MQNEMKTLLRKYGYHPTDYGIGQILNTWRERKANLIRLLEGTPGYNGNYQVVFPVSFPREIESHAVYDFFNNMRQYAYSQLAESEMSYSEWDGSSRNCFFGFLFRDVEKVRKFNLIDYFINYWTPKRELSVDDAQCINEWLPEMKAHSGQKASRVIMKYCKMVGYDKTEDFNCRYAVLSDAITPGRIKQLGVISVNPVDYYTSAFGNSWTTCATIDKEDVHGYDLGFHGTSSGGCGSYMEDGVTFLFYTIDRDYKGNTPELEKKIYRNLFHYDGNRLVQGRVYPKDKDGATDLYKEFRETVMEKLFPGVEWTTEFGTDACIRATLTCGHHYPDYECFSDCNVSTPVEREDEDFPEIIIGSSYHCPCCGRLHNRKACIECEKCYNNNEDEEE